MAHARTFHYSSSLRTFQPQPHFNEPDRHRRMDSLHRSRVQHVGRHRRALQHLHRAFSFSCFLSLFFAACLSTPLLYHQTEEDFAEIAAAGLNWIRLPIPYWIIEVYPGEPFLANVGWTYFLKALTWARKYGLRVNLDYHATPGSVNGAFDFELRVPFLC